MPGYDLSDYTQLIPGQNSDKPRFMAWVAANLQPFVDSQAISLSMHTAFNLDDAVGVQLDIIGQQLGQGRVVDFTPEGGVSPTLNDDMYRLVLKARVLLNGWKGTRQEVYDYWQRVFPQYGIQIVDGQDMTMNYVLYGLPLDPSALMPFTWGASGLGWGQGYWTLFGGGLLRELFRNGYLTPEPAGVAVTYSFSDSAVFAWNQDNDYLKGWSEGTWLGS